MTKCGATAPHNQAGGPKSPVRRVVENEQSPYTARRLQHHDPVEIPDAPANQPRRPEERAEGSPWVAHHPNEARRDRGEPSPSRQRRWAERLGISRRARRIVDLSRLDGLLRCPGTGSSRSTEKWGRRKAPALERSVGRGSRWFRRDHVRLPGRPHSCPRTQRRCNPIRANRGDVGSPGRARYAPVGHTCQITTYRWWRKGGFFSLSPQSRWKSPLLRRDEDRVLQAPAILELLEQQHGRQK